MVYILIQAQAAGKLAHLYNSASGICDLINVCSSDDNGVQPPMQVVCDMDTEGGGWIEIMRRKRTVVAHTSFHRTWDHYENGFGSFNTEFWLGLRNIHCLTTRDDVDLTYETIMVTE